MRVVKFHQNLLDACAEFWWRIYEHMLYVHTPSGYQTVNSPPIGPQYFVKRLTAGLDSSYSDHWAGEVTDDSIFLAVDSGKVEGILVNSIDREKLTGNILSAYMQRDYRGREIADGLLSEVLERFRKMGLHRVVAGPYSSASMEVECPIHLALLDTGFAWENSWDPAYREPEYGVFLGGSLQGFRLQPEIKEKREKLRKEGITIERVTADEFRNLRRLDTGGILTLGDDVNLGDEVNFVALVDGLAVGWTFEAHIFEDEGRIMSMVGPEVIPSYRKKGIGKVVHHLGTEEVVRQGAQYGWTATNIHNSARLIYRSIGYRYWYTSFNLMSKRLR